MGHTRNVGVSAFEGISRCALEKANPLSVLSYGQQYHTTHTTTGVTCIQIRKVNGRGASNVIVCEAAACAQAVHCRTARRIKRATTSRGCAVPCFGRAERGREFCSRKRHCSSCCRGARRGRGGRCCFCCCSSTPGDCNHSMCATPCLWLMRRVWRGRAGGAAWRPRRSRGPLRGAARRGAGALCNAGARACVRVGGLCILPCGAGHCDGDAGGPRRGARVRGGVAAACAERT